MSYPSPPNPAGQDPAAQNPPGYPQFAGGAPAPAGKQRLRGRTPLRLSFVFLLLAVVAVVIGVILLVRGYKSTIDGFQRVTFADGQKALTLDKGDYVVYFETPVGEARSGSGAVAIRSASGQTVKLSPYGQNGSSTTSLTYTSGGRRGVAQLKFVAPASGRYLVTLTGNAPADDGVALGSSIAGKLVAGVLLVVAGVLLFIVFVILLIIGLVKRSRHKKQLANPYGGAGGYGGPQSGYPQQPQSGYPQQPQSGYPQQGYPPPGYPPPPSSS